MIDTDKYEGHLIDKAVEDNSQVWAWSAWMLGKSMTIEQHNATAELLRDAHLLFEEVKRLREQIQLLHDTWYADEMASDVDERMTTLLKEMVE